MSWRGRARHTRAAHAPGLRRNQSRLDLTSHAPIALLPLESAMSSSCRPLTIARPPACREQGSRLADRWPVPHPLARLGQQGIVRIKREGDKGTPAGRFRLLWGYYRPDRVRLRTAGAPLKPLRRDQGWCEDPSSPRYNRPVRLPARDCTDRMWREDHLYDLTFVLDQNFSRRAKGRGSAIFFHLARVGLTPTAGCVAISAADMRKLAPRLARRRGHGDRVASPPTQNRRQAGRFPMIASTTS